MQDSVRQGHVKVSIEYYFADCSISSFNEAVGLTEVGWNGSRHSRCGKRQIDW